MSRVMFEELKRISAEMKAIGNGTEQDGRKKGPEEQDALDQLETDRDVLLGDIIFHGYGPQRPC